MISELLELKSSQINSILKSFLDDDFDITLKKSALEIVFEQQIIFIGKDFFSFSGTNYKKALSVLSYFSEPSIETLLIRVWSEFFEDLMSFEDFKKRLMK